MLNFRQWLEDAVGPALSPSTKQGTGLAELKPVVEPSKSKKSKKIDKLFGKGDGNNVIPQNR
ncbi:MAG: hypothetical protein ACW99G_01395 [Candidatus Thorarchaeota archaeon]|jgi:hypothetical protein